MVRKWSTGPISLFYTTPCFLTRQCASHSGVGRAPPVRLGGCCSKYEFGWVGSPQVRTSPPPRRRCRPPASSATTSTCPTVWRRSSRRKPQGWHRWVRNFPTHGQLSAAQGSPTSCLNSDFAILNLFAPSAPWSDGPEVEHGAHFLILYYPLFPNSPVRFAQWCGACPSRTATRGKTSPTSRCGMHSWRTLSDCTSGTRRPSRRTCRNRPSRL
jgi:hypothetical protein